VNKANSYRFIRGYEWIKGLNRIETRDDLPLSIQGGEPTLHPDFYRIIRKIDKHINIDLLTNMTFDVDEFMKHIPPERLKRKSPYASIRVSYHPEVMDLAPLVDKVTRMLKNGYSVGVWIVDHPRDHMWVKAAKAIMEYNKIDCRIKEFLGYYKDKLYGTYRYTQAMDGKRKECMCKPSELLIAPNGNIHRCHYDLYNNKYSYSHILDSNIILPNKHVACDNLGLCNPCDIKVKTNRFQVFGHSSVDIKEI
jgi:MoaA/NifB/PqqE/SkfB family radical SAM enzyme